MKNLVIIALIAVGGYLAWQNLPGLRDKVTQAANKYGGWTEEARKNDPVGFIAHARKELEKDITEFETAQGELGTMRKENQDKLEEYRDEQQNSTKLAGEFRELFKAAEESNTWPVAALNREYTRTQLVDQVQELLTTKDEAAKMQAQYQLILDKIEDKAGTLRDRISDSRSAVSDLEAQESMMKVEKLSEEADVLLAKVNDLVEGNSKVADDPIRSSDELMAEAAKAAKADTATVEDTATMDFLNG